MLISDDIIRPLLRRLKALEDGTPRVRKGQVTATNPLSVKLGGASTAYSNVRTLDAAGYVVGDLVSVITYGNDLLVLGRIGDGSASAGPPVVTALPASPSDGQEVIFEPAGAAAGIGWHLHYRAAIVGAYKWLCVGGASLWTYHDGSGSCSSANGFTSALNDGADMSITLPVGGIYDVELEVGLATSDVGSTYVEAGPTWTGLATTYSDLASAWIVTGGSGAPLRRRRRPTLAAGNVVNAAYHTGSGTATFSRRTLTAMPVRVG